MDITTLSSREFNQDTRGAKKATRRGPVFITNRGRPEHVLLSIAEYEKLTCTHTNIVELLVMPQSDDIEFEAERAVAAFVCSTPGRTERRAHY